MSQQLNVPIYINGSSDTQSDRELYLDNDTLKRGSNKSGIKVAESVDVVNDNLQTNPSTDNVDVEISGTWKSKSDSTATIKDVNIEDSNIVDSNIEGTTTISGTTNINGSTDLQGTTYIGTQSGDQTQIGSSLSNTTITNTELQDSTMTGDTTIGDETNLVKIKKSKLSGNTQIGTTSGDTTTIGGSGTTTIISGTTNINGSTNIKNNSIHIKNNSETSKIDITQSGVSISGTTNIGTTSGNTTTIGNASATTIIKKATLDNNTMTGTTNIGTTSGNTTNIGNTGTTTNIKGTTNIGTTSGSTTNIGTTSGNTTNIGFNSGNTINNNTIINNATLKGANNVKDALITGAIDTRPAVNAFSTAGVHIKNIHDPSKNDQVHIALLRSNITGKENEVRIQANANQAVNILGTTYINSDNSENPADTNIGSKNQSGQKTNINSPIINLKNNDSSEAEPQINLNTISLDIKAIDTKFNTRLFVNSNNISGSSLPQGEPGQLFFVIENAGESNTWHKATPYIYG